MAKIENQFIDIPDSTLEKMLAEYENWRDSGFIPETGPLAAARDKYCDAYDAHGLVLMERDLLYAAAKRWLEIRERK
jgi:hypothetical protein